MKRSTGNEIIIFIATSHAGLAEKTEAWLGRRFGGDETF